MKSYLAVAVHTLFPSKWSPIQLTVRRKIGKVRRPRPAF